MNVLQYYAYIWGAYMSIFSIEILVKVNSE